jgi:hypothetical protein
MTEAEKDLARFESWLSRYDKRDEEGLRLLFQFLKTAGILVCKVLPGDFDQGGNERYHALSNINSALDWAAMGLDAVEREKAKGEK